MHLNSVTVLKCDVPTELKTSKMFMKTWSETIELFFSIFSFQGRHSDHHVTSSKDGFGNFIVHEGCFEMTGVNPDESRNDPQNANSVCIDYCVDNGITYAATISDRCLCLSSLPSNKLADDQCDAQCPGNIFEEGEACVGFGCCGSEINNAASIYQSVPASRDKNVNKSKKTKEMK